jgi:peroxiredoxin
MLQAAIAGRMTPSPDGYPAKGDLIRDFQLCTSEGRAVLLSDFRGRSKMVLVFTGEQAAGPQLLLDLEVHQKDFAETETRILVIVAGSQQHASELNQSLHLDFAVLADVGGQVHRSAGTEDQTGHPQAAVYITDRFGEIFAAYKAEQAESLPSVAEILRWVEFINIQCPECGPSEWPA